MNTKKLKKILQCQCFYLPLIVLMSITLKSNAQTDELQTIQFLDISHDLTLLSESKISDAQISEIYVQDIRVEGNTILQQEISDLTQPFIGKTISISELNTLADSITELYLNQGYITSRAVLSQQSFTDGLVKIDVLEGEVENIIIKGASRLENYVKGKIELGLGKPLNSGELENQLRLLKRNPLFENVEATLKSGSEEKKSVLEVYVSEANPFYGGIGIDNYSPPSVGGVEANLNLGYRNVLGLGDGISVQYTPRLQAFTGTYQVDTIYQIPLNPMDGVLQLRASIQNNEVIQEEFRDLNISQESQYYEISYRQPLIRTPEEEFALSLGFGYRDNQTFDFQGPAKFLAYDDNGVSRTSILFFGQDYVSRDPIGVWGFSSQFRFGTGLFDATTNSDGVPDGHFFSWLGQIQRVQVLDKNNFLIIQADAQLTPDSLLPSEQFVIGGAQSVRGYRQNARSGDSGVRFSVEDRITLVRNSQEEAVFLVAPFFDMGYVWNNSNQFTFQESQRFIAGLGLGFIWQPISGMTVRLDYAPPLIYLDNRGNNIQDNGFYFSVNYQL
jgi:hemolysin activation/secretion protein